MFSEAAMIRTTLLFCYMALFATLSGLHTAVAQQKDKTATQHSAKEKPVLPKADLSVDEARMIVKDIPSVDIRATLGTWKLSEPELGQLRQWSGLLVEKPGSTEFLTKW